LLGYVEARNDNPNFDYAQIKANFETIATSLLTRLTTLQTSAQGTDILLRDKCLQLAKLLRDVIQDVRHELIASSPASSGAHAQQTPAHSNLAARLPRNTTDAVTLIKSVLAAAQGITSGSTSPTLPGEPQLRPLPIPVPSSASSSSSQRSYASPTTFVQHSPMRATTSSTSSRPLSLTRTNSSPHSLRDAARVQSISSPASHDRPVSPRQPATATSPRQPATATSPTLSLSDPLSTGMHRTVSLPQHTGSPQLNLNATPSPNRSLFGSKKGPSIGIYLLFYSFVLFNFFSSCLGLC
jgi:hypothetical protein